MKRKMWFQNVKIKLIVVGIIILIGFVIFLSCGIGKLLYLFELLTLLGYARPVLPAILGWGGGRDYKRTAARLYYLITFEYFKSTAERLYALNTRRLHSQRTEFSLAVTASSFGFRTEKRPSRLGARLATT
ncbi:unnamed protein product [Prunus armeniaca]